MRECAGGCNQPQIDLAAIPGVMRCACGCGGSCEENMSVARCACGCGGTCEDSVARAAAPGGGSAGRVCPRRRLLCGGARRRGLEGRTRSRMERSFGRDFGGVRVHTDADAANSAKALSARAYTVGDHIVFGAGQYAPHHRDGQRLIAHELTHTVQQRDRRHVQRAGTVSQPGDAHEREAVSVANAVVAGFNVAPARTPPADAVSRDVLDDVLSFGGGVVEGIGEAASDVGGAIVDVGEEAVDFVAGGVKAAWDLAHDIADAIDGAISVSGCGITVTVPPRGVEALTLNVPLPSASLKLPVAVGVWPIAGVVNAYGMLYLDLTAAPSLAVQLGPASLNSGSIFVDWCDPSFGGAVDFTFMLAAVLGAQLRGGVGGEVGLEVNVPVPPGFVPILIPLASVDVGVLGAVLGTGATKITQCLALSYGAGGFTYADDTLVDAGLKLSAGVGAFGSLSALGFTLCTLYWPLWTKAWSDTMAFDSGINLSIGTGGISASLAPPTAAPADFEFDDLSVALNTDVLTDKCPIVDAVCRVMYALGKMPSQSGGTWAGHEPPRWPGPLDVYQRDTGIASKALCRGACGPHCDTCRHLADRRECVDDGTRHHWVVYPQFEDCPTHQACKEHDGCYDWCSEGGASQFSAFFCRRLCDLECLCQNSAGECVGWIFGVGGSGQMWFSDEPRAVAGCQGPCPTAQTDEAGGSTLRTCLEPVTLTQPVTVSDSLRDSTPRIPIYSDVVPLGYAGFVVVNVTADGSFVLSGSATVDSVRLDNLCLDVDPKGPTYTGTADLHVPVTLAGSLSGTGAVHAAASWVCLLDALADAGLTATASATNQTELVVSAVAVVCEGGELDLSSSATLINALHLAFDLDAFLRLMVLRHQIFSHRWKLLHETWDREWQWKLDILNRRGAGAGAIVPALAVGAITAVELLRHLIGVNPDEDGQPQPQRGVVDELVEFCAPTAPPPQPGGQPVDLTCGTPHMPLTHVTFSSSADRGEHMLAQPLTHCEGNTHGSEPLDSIFGNVWTQCIARPPPNDQRSLWVRAHLLHGETSSSGSRNLHGPGDDAQNLILTDKSLNGRMNTMVERNALFAAYDEHRVLWYEVDVNHFSNSGDRRYYGETVTMAWGGLRPDHKLAYHHRVQRPCGLQHQAPAAAVSELHSVRRPWSGASSTRRPDLPSSRRTAATRWAIRSDAPSPAAR